MGSLEDMLVTVEGTKAVNIETYIMGMHHGHV